MALCIWNPIIDMKLYSLGFRTTDVYFLLKNIGSPIDLPGHSETSVQQRIIKCLCL